MSSIIEVVDDRDCKYLCPFLAIGLKIKYAKMQSIEDKSVRRLKQRQFTE